MQRISESNAFHTVPHKRDDHILAHAADSSPNAMQWWETRNSSTCFITFGISTYLLFTYMDGCMYFFSVFSLVLSLLSRSLNNFYVKPCMCTIDRPFSTYMVSFNVSRVRAVNLGNETKVKWKNKSEMISVNVISVKLKIYGADRLLSLVDDNLVFFMDQWRF